MKKIINFVKKNMLVILVIISLGLNVVVLANTAILSEQVSYTNNKTAETTVNGALDELFSAVDINNRLGSTDISNTGDGTITGAISTLNNDIGILKRKTIINGWAGQLSSPFTYTLDGYGASYLVTIATVGNSNVSWIDIYVVSTAPNNTGKGYVMPINNSGVNTTGIEVTLSENTLTITAPNEAYWANIGIRKL